MSFFFPSTDSMYDNMANYAAAGNNNNGKISDDSGNYTSDSAVEGANRPAQPKAKANPGGSSSSGVYMPGTGYVQ